MHYTYQINHDYKMINVITKGDLIIKELAPMELKISKIAKQLKYKYITRSTEHAHIKIFRNIYIILVISDFQFNNEKK